MPQIVTVCAACQYSQYREMPQLTHFLNLPAPFKIVRCVRCGLMWLSPMPTDEEYQAVYSSTYFSPKSEEINVSHPEWVRCFPPVGEYEDYIRQREIWYEIRLDRIRKIAPQSQTLLDVGAATADFLAIARTKGWQVNGLELSAYACQKAMEKYGIHLECVDLKHFNPRGKTYDVVHLSHVFEHFTDPNGALDRLKRLMNADSMLVIEVPNQFRGLLEILVRTLKRIEQQSRNLHAIHHPYFYAPANLQQLLNNHGLKTLSIRTHFPERWGTSWRQHLLKAIERGADFIASRGENIEIIARRND